MAQTTQSQKWNQPAEIVGQRPHTLSVKPQLDRRGKPLQRFTLGDFRFEIKTSHDTLWIIARNKVGGVALRGAYAPDGEIHVDKAATHGRVTTFSLTASTLGKLTVAVETYGDEQAIFRLTVTLTPSDRLLMPPAPWNIYPIDIDNNPVKTQGIVHAAQRGSAAGVLYFSVTKPAFGSVLYFQNLSALTDYCEQTHTTPNTAVGYSWPGMGFMLPAADKEPLTPGKAYGVCDAFIHLSPVIPESPQQSAGLFLEMLAAVYTQLPKPATEYHDWPAMAKATLRDLNHSPKCRVEEHGYLYLHPYTASEYPDSMVQLTVLLPLLEYSDWSGTALPITKRLREAVPNFYDPKLGTIRRYLSTVGPDKQAMEVDSWYLYHPLTNLARLAKRGDDGARELFLKSVQFGIKVGQRFKYSWPVKYHLGTLNIIEDVRKPGEGGQTDVPGIYAAVMLEAWELTGDANYLAEAQNAIQSLRPLGFTIGYQFNLVAIGALACVRLWKITGDAYYREQSEVLLASFFHNTNIWECDFGPAKFFRTFMGVTCLHDGAYMAAYEEFEAYAAFRELLRVAGDELSRPVRLLLTEYCRYALEHCWFYYPSELPADQLSEEVRNGHIDRKLAIPLEDLYADWQKPGAVGQEIYGAGMAFTLATRSHYQPKGVPFTVYCDYPLVDIAITKNRMTCRVQGESDFTCRLRLIKAGRALPKVKVVDTATGDAVPSRPADGVPEFLPSGGMGLTLIWA